jgi:shikimate kinase
MGSGKSKVAREIGRRLKLEVIVTDDLAEAQEGQTIHEIFKSKGEAYFRDLEQASLKKFPASRCYH